MRPLLLVAGLAALGTLPAAAPRASAHHRPDRDTPGSLVGVSIEVDGRWTPLYRAPDGSGRYYVEARRGARYTVRLDNRSQERLGVALTVDGLNVISGQRPAGPGPGRMYVLEPWDSTEVQGWRTDLDSVQRFTFVDEERSYAVRSGKANSKMGWIELAVYRERHPYVYRHHDEITPPRPRYEGQRDRPLGSEPGAKSREDSSGAASAPAGHGHARAGRPRVGFGAPGLPRHRLGPARRRSGRGGPVRRPAPPGRAHHRPLRIRARSARPGHPARQPAVPRPAVGARERPRRLRAAPALVGARSA